ncbi:hypothetical protein DNTS_002895, partial [Danionella cerebrum]
RRAPLNEPRLCVTRQVIEGYTASELDVQLPQTGLLIQVRTKKRYFTPPSRDTNMIENDEQARARRRDARVSTLSKEAFTQRAVQVRQRAGSQLAIRMIKKHDLQFTAKEFPGKAQQIFIEANEALAVFNKEKLHSLVTERCYPEMVRGNRMKTIRWRFIESLEPPSIVHVRCPDMVNKGNVYGQITVRMHSRQTLAVYDRFGRLMLGDEEQPRDVLEYIVLERHLVDPYGSWRLHGKIIPSWSPPKDPGIRTIMIPGPKLKPDEEFEDLNYEVPKPKAVQWSK